MTQSAGTGKSLQTTEDFRGLSTKHRADLVRMPSQTHTLEKMMVRQLGKCEAIKKVLVLFLLWPWYHVCVGVFKDSLTLICKKSEIFMVAVYDV